MRFDTEQDGFVTKTMCFLLKTMDCEQLRGAGLRRYREQVRPLTPPHTAVTSRNAANSSFLSPSIFISLVLTLKLPLRRHIRLFEREQVAICI